MKLGKLIKPSAKLFTLIGAFEEDTKNPLIIKKVGHITELVTEFKAVIWLGKKSAYSLETLKDNWMKIVEYSRDAQIDVASLTTKAVSSAAVVRQLVEGYFFAKAKLYSRRKVASDKTEVALTLVNYQKGDEAVFEKARLIAEVRNDVRDLQVTPPNELNAVTFADRVVKTLKTSGLKITVLKKPEIEKLNMGLILGVNKGSAIEPRVVVLEYKGDPKQKALTALVGKGITFDTGGYNLKPSSSMGGMKFDMSGAAVVYGVMQLIAKLKPKANVAAVLTLTDNAIGSRAITPDTVLVSMNGKSVEINNTDAEGRLVLADGMTYALRNLKATRVIDVATLTGAIMVALGQTYTGVYASNDQTWKAFKAAAATADELVWRMPLHKDFSKGLTKSKVADLKNVVPGGWGGANVAAMFLKEFTEDADWMHLDIAGTADISEVAYAPMVESLWELISNGK